MKAGVAYMSLVHLLATKRILGPRFGIICNNFENWALPYVLLHNHMSYKLAVSK